MSSVALVCARIAILAPALGWVAGVVGLSSSAHTLYAFVGAGLVGFVCWVAALVAGGFAMVDGERRGFVALAIAGLALVSWCTEWVLFINFGDLNPLNL